MFESQGQKIKSVKLLYRGSEQGFTDARKLLDKMISEENVLNTIVLFIYSVGLLLWLVVDFESVFLKIFRLVVRFRTLRVFYISLYFCNF